MVPRKSIWIVVLFLSFGCGLRIRMKLSARDRFVLETIDDVVIREYDWWTHCRRVDENSVLFPHLCIRWSVDACYHWCEGISSSEPVSFYSDLTLRWTPDRRRRRRYPDRNTDHEFHSELSRRCFRCRNEIVFPSEERSSRNRDHHHWGRTWNSVDEDWSISIDRPYGLDEGDTHQPTLIDQERSSIDPVFPILPGRTTFEQCNRTSVGHLIDQEMSLPCIPDHCNGQRDNWRSASKFWFGRKFDHWRNGFVVVVQWGKTALLHR